MATVLASPLTPRGKLQLIAFIGTLMALGCLVTSFLSYRVSRDELRSAIITQELPLTSDNIYSEMQKDLLSPVLISSMMASNSFMRNWVVTGEKDLSAMTEYLHEVRRSHRADTSFFVSAITHNYYHADGLRRKVEADNPRDNWFFRLQNYSDPYEISVDQDSRNNDLAVVFINYRFFDKQGRFLGVTGVGLKAQTIQEQLRDYEKRYHRRVYFVDKTGKVTLSGAASRRSGQNLKMAEGIKDLLPEIFAVPRGSWQYRDQTHDYQLNVRFIPEMHWHLFVEKAEDEAFDDIRSALYTNLLLGALVIPLILWVVVHVLNRYQKTLESLATTDQLSGLYNRHAFEALAEQLFQSQVRTPEPISALLIDLDHFKRINDRYGHLIGDQALTHIATILRDKLRKSDIACRWGGEEFLVLCKGCSAQDAYAVAQTLRGAIYDNPIPLADTALHCSASIGVAERQANETLESLTARTDQALYRAKEKGRNCVELATGAS